VAGTPVFNNLVTESICSSVNLAADMPCALATEATSSRPVGHARMALTAGAAENAGAAEELGIGGGRAARRFLPGSTLCLGENGDASESENILAGAMGRSGLLGIKSCVDSVPVTGLDVE